ncbi:MAG: ATP-binding protein [Candidatus Omnitrophica bacterium]|nr:ATP-binding protein [Candidatus Omnitrophota bacterium]MDD5429487.1 ATP-binding protein [Candidatus Omnitrophota bacterium]
MKKIVVISGKGGTGKTVVTGALAALSSNYTAHNDAFNNGAVMADCDVDAADLHLLLNPAIREKHEFRAGVTAFIDQEKCTKCGKCRQVCRFSAIGEDFSIDSVSCEGCAFCSFVCPVGAIEMRENVSGEWFISDTRFGPLVHAKLGIAEENSGKLVSLVRQEAEKIAKERKSDWVIIDGSPGIGCPVIASLNGVDCALVVTEPTLSGLHDAKRVISVARHFGVMVKLAVNKYDLNIDVTKSIEEYCRAENIQVLGKISFDKSIVEAMLKGETIVESSSEESKRQVKEVWEKLCCLTKDA